jgi:hypothetical protein
MKMEDMMKAFLTSIAVILILAAPINIAAGGAPRIVAGDFEIGLSGDIARLFNSETTGFNFGLGFGYFVTDWLEIGIGGSVNYLTDSDKRSGTTGDFTSDLTLSRVSSLRFARRANALTSGPAASGFTGWSGSVKAQARVFPLASMRTMPPMLAPFIGLEFGSLFSEDLDPFMAFSGSVGLHILIAKGVAITPEIGYAMIYALDDLAKFGGESLEHVFGFNWGLSVFF